jgi:hypothetical protein
MQIEIGLSIAGRKARGMSFAHVESTAVRGRDDDDDDDDQGSVCSPRAARGQLIDDERVIVQGRTREAGVRLLSVVHHPLPICVVARPNYERSDIGKAFRAPTISYL